MACIPGWPQPEWTDLEVNGRRTGGNVEAELRPQGNVGVGGEGEGERGLEKPQFGANSHS